MTPDNPMQTGQRLLDVADTNTARLRDELIGAGMNGADADVVVAPVRARLHFMIGEWVGSHG